MIILVITLLSEGLRGGILKAEFAFLKSQRITEINKIKSGDFSRRTDGASACETPSSYPKISWFGKNDIILDNLSKDSFRVRFFLPRSHQDKICLVYSEDGSFNERVKYLNKVDEMSTHIKLEENWYLTCLPEVSRFEEFFP
jgi:hypothetical protein